MAHNNTNQVKLQQAGRGLIILLCFYLIVTTIQAIVDLWRADNKQVVREKEVTGLRKAQEGLKREKMLAGTTAYRERIARDQLGMSKPGEEIIIIPAELLIDQTPVASPDARPNWQKWAGLFW